MRRNHTKAFKEEAVKLELEEGYAISEAALNIKRGGSLLRERNGLRYQFIDTEKKGYTIVLLCQVMRSGNASESKWVLFMAEARGITSSDRK